eukprot:TRINITY_DN3381_c0_g2_i2.p2 TRINITY_DN3381_c0_g2~~TRINITY_DN3381_c0_g2_i2.p2  ORF type:complete len:217 (-),score=53.35 TRINITY_DN3381_c0_g2_i2:883-1533(-)
MRPLLCQRKPMNGVFAADPATLVQTNYGNSKIPLVLFFLKESLVGVRGLSKPGIFRVTGDKTRMRRLRQRLNMKQLLQVSGDDAHCLASLIKQWYRELPGRILMGVNLSTYKADNAVSLPVNLAEPKRTLFNWLIDLLSETLREKDLNKTSPVQLASALAPVLVDVSKPLEEATAAAEQAAAILYFIISLRTGQRESIAPVFNRAELQQNLKSEQA